MIGMKLYLWVALAFFVIGSHEGAAKEMSRQQLMNNIRISAGSVMCDDKKLANPCFVGVDKNLCGALLGGVVDACEQKLATAIPAVMGTAAEAKTAMLPMNQCIGNAFVALLQKSGHMSKAAACR